MSKSWGRYIQIDQLEFKRSFFTMLYRARCLASLLWPSLYKNVKIWQWYLDCIKQYLWWKQMHSGFRQGMMHKLHTCYVPSSSCFWPRACYSVSAYTDELDCLSELEILPLRHQVTNPAPRAPPKSPAADWSCSQQALCQCLQSNRHDVQELWIIYGERRNFVTASFSIYCR